MKAERSRKLCALAENSLEGGGARKSGVRLFSHMCFVLQEFAISKNIQLGDEKGLKFPSVWDWSLQFTVKDRTLFHNPYYIGKSTPCIQNGSRKSFKRTKVNGRQQHPSSRDPCCCSTSQCLWKC